MDDDVVPTEEPVHSVKVITQKDTLGCSEVYSEGFNPVQNTDKSELTADKLRGRYGLIDKATLSSFTGLSSKRKIKKLRSILDLYEKIIIEVEGHLGEWKLDRQVERSNLILKFSNRMYYSFHCLKGILAKIRPEIDEEDYFSSLKQNFCRCSMKTCQWQKEIFEHRMEEEVRELEAACHEYSVIK